MVTPPRFTPEEIRERVQQLPAWFHTMDLPGGVETPGAWARETGDHVTRAMNDIDFRDKTVLDVGCLDGRWTFEAERRGAAEIVATDLVSAVKPSREPYFRLAHELLGSKAEYHTDVSVFELDKLGRRDFDIVLYFGVYYHLKDPLLSISRIRQVIREGGLLVIEGQVFDSPEIVARFFYRTPFTHDLTNWWVPSVPCLREWVECSFFDLEREYSTAMIPHGGLPATGRHVIRARAVRRADSNYMYPDDELAAFDLNTYPTE
jgi:tRNA (mo5U34)-methyltransferase